DYARLARIIEECTGEKKLGHARRVRDDRLPRLSADRSWNDPAGAPYRVRAEPVRGRALPVRVRPRTGGRGGRRASPGPGARLLGAAGRADRAGRWGGGPRTGRDPAGQRRWSPHLRVRWRGPGATGARKAAG